jgi:hypothetical protein
VSSPSDPPPPVKPSRSALGMRDLLGALLVLVTLVLVVAGLARACTFSPGGATVDPSVGPRVDAGAELRRIARSVPFAVRVPAVPPGWRSNAVDQALVDGGRVVRAGFVPEAGRYVRLTQSDAPADSLLATAGSVAGQGTEGHRAAATGTIDAGGLTWTALAGQGGEQAWLAEVAGPDGPPVRLLITGSAAEPEFRALAEAIAVGEVLPPGRAPN